MILRSIANRLRDRGPRQWATALCALVVLVGSGLPCACACLGHESVAAARPSATALHDASADGADADHCGDPDHCPTPSLCSADPAPALAIGSAWQGPTFDPLVAWQCAPHQQIAPRELAIGPRGQ